jgi:hypothetical protein
VAESLIHSTLNKLTVMMKKTLAIIAAASLVLGGTVKAGAPSKYQVTGPVLELTDTAIVVKKGNDRWEVARSPQTKVTGDLKVGAKVTIEYTMTAQTVEVKADKK